MAKKKRKVRLRWGRILLAALVVVVLVGGLTAGIAAFMMWNKAQDIVAEGKNTYIAILGTDERSNQKKAQRADAIMLAAVNFDTSTVDLISMPRDSYVYIPCVDRKDKITHSFQYGERACTLDTLENLFEIPEITTYVHVNFESVISMVDDLGGIELSPSASFTEWNVKKTKKFTFEQGVKTEMDGEMALAYARHRKSDSDIFRAQRQQEVIMAMIKKAKTLDKATVLSLGTKVLEEIDTNITIVDAMTYYTLAMREEFVITKTHAKGSDMTKDGVYYYKLDTDWVNETKERIRQALEKKEENTTE
ncbi:MAG: LCP family protein [Erysipelotrichaceae bacterium]|nr:LCP family protein [Erysipelotrichaceae bacterium]